MVIKCKFCEKTDHLSKDCPKDLSENDLCIKCLSTKHESSNCPFIKCLRCNRIGHVNSECPVNHNEAAKCTRCKHIGHLAEDCLINPMAISSDMIKSVYCFFCKEVGHFLCRVDNCYMIEDGNYYDSDNSNKTELAYDKKIKKESKNKTENYKVSCPNCAGSHFLSDCKNNYNNNLFDNLRSQNAKSFFLIGPSKLAQNKNFLNDSFSSDDDENNNNINENLSDKKNFDNYKDRQDINENKILNNN
jgi:hypothetical protein